MAARQHNQRFLEAVNDAKTRVRELTVDDLKARQAAGERFMLIDVREESEWAAGHASNATHLGKGIIERDIESLVTDPSTELVLYCGGGFRSALAGDALQKMGYTRVWSLAGGWRDYQASGLPVAK